MLNCEFAAEGPALVGGADRSLDVSLDISDVALIDDDCDACLDKR